MRDGAAQPDEKMREVLAHAAWLAEDLDDGRLHRRDAGYIVEALIHEMHQPLRRLEGVCRRRRSVRSGERLELWHRGNERRRIQAVGER